MKNILESIKNNPRTLLLVNREGEILDFIPLKELPKDSMGFSNLVKSRNKGPCAVSIIHQNNNVTEALISRKISDCVESLIYGDKHEMKPGINIPERDAKGWRKLWWKLKLFYNLSKIKIQDFFNKG